MCGTSDLQLDLCYKEQQHHADTTIAASTTTTLSPSGRSGSRSRNSENSTVEEVWKETQQLMEDCEQLVRIMTHVCSQQFSGAYRTLARYSQGCWRGCSASETAAAPTIDGSRHTSQKHVVHQCSQIPPTSSSPAPPSLSSLPSRHPSCCALSSSSSSSSALSCCSCQQMSAVSCKGCCCVSSSGCNECGCCEGSITTLHHLREKYQQRRLQEEEKGCSCSCASASPACSSSSSCRWRGGWGRRWRWRRCQCAQCHQAQCRHQGCSRCYAETGGGGVDGHTYPSSSAQPSADANCSTTTVVSTTATITNTTTDNTPCPTGCSTTTCPIAMPSCPSHYKATPTPTQSGVPTTTTPTARGKKPSRRTSFWGLWPLDRWCPPSPSSSFSAAPASPKPRGGAPSILTILLVLVVTLARFADGCSSRSTPKPRPASPTMRPNITFQTYACPPAYAAWYCLNGATCFTVKIGESILYNCECADGYMGQRCEFKDLDGSYLPAREKVLMETASIAGGATVACVLVFIVLFAVYIFMQKDKDKRCRDLDDGRDNDRRPFSGYQNPRPEIFRTITNPYARTIDELSHVEVESPGHGNTGSGRNGSGGTSGGGNIVDSNLHSGQHQASSSPTS